MVTNKPDLLDFDISCAETTTPSSFVFVENAITTPKPSISPAKWEYLVSLLP
jgi:hypothetical protein